jgi:hypothetical protein
LKPRLGEAVRSTAPHLLTFDPALSDHIRNDPWAEAHRFDPTSAPQVLHKLPFAGIRKFHFFTFGWIFSAR